MLAKRHSHWLWVMLLGSCLLPNLQEIAGQWRAVALYENGQMATLPLDSVRLYLHPDGYYTFQSAARYREVGKYRTTGKYLFLTDTTRQPAAEERALKVLYASPDTLKIEMAGENKVQVLVMSR